MDFMDEPYEMMIAERPLDSPLSPLSAWAGYFLQHHNVATLIALRWASYIITIASIAAAAWLCRPMLRSKRGGGYAGLSFGVATMLSAPYAGSWLYGWDIFSNAALTLTMAWLCMLARRPSCISAFIGGGLAAVATLCRVPDVLVLPAVLAVSVYSLPQRRAEAAAAVLAAFVIVVAGFILPVYGGIGNYINSIAVNAIGGHSITTMIQNTFSGM
ncbi:MAG: hypothetical protein K2L99_03300, partial [Muribaculaceae bacterium]|nr:hypothetical protein [Muribaculaceae bacterium]